MPNWRQVLNEIERDTNRANRQPASVDRVRRRYMAKLAKHTGRNVICYYSSWLTSEDRTATEVRDDDKNGIMAAVHGLTNNGAGLDLVLHTPGGDPAATESIVEYLRDLFENDIRVVVPHIAMSAGTMIACSGHTIVMGKQSNLGPIDPQLGGMPAPAIIAEFYRAIEEIKDYPPAVEGWRHIIGKYQPTLLDQCQKAIDWSKEMVKEWLMTGMFSGDTDAEEKAQRVVDNLSDSDSHKNHSRHIHTNQLEALGLNIKRLEDDDRLQDLVLTVHHAYMHSFSRSPAVKIIENHKGTATISARQPRPGN